MKESFTKRIFKGMKPGVAAIICCVICLGLLIPTVYLGKYNFMKADDFSYGSTTHNVYLSTGSLWETVKEAVNVSKTTYETWQGTFSSVFLMSLQPGVFDYRLYKLVSAMMISMIVISSLLLSRTLICKAHWHI